MSIDILIASLQREAMLFPEKTIARNDLLCVPGKVNDDFFFVESGTLALFSDTNEKEDPQMIRFGYQNNFIACLDAFFTGAPSIYGIQAIRASKVRVMPKSSIKKLLQAIPQGLELWHQFLVALILQQLEREQDILLSDPSARYARVLARSPQLFQEIPQKYIANYLRMEPETLSRLKK